MENGAVGGESTSDTGIEWVEIVEPQTKQHMYANLRTGQCAWEPPSGVSVKRTHPNQWWELYDTNTQRFYYYNATSMKTVWQRPVNCDIIPLAKLQSLKENTEGTQSEDSPKCDEPIEKETSTKKNSETQTSPKDDRRGFVKQLVNTVYAQNLSPDLGLVSTRRGGFSRSSLPRRLRHASDVSGRSSPVLGSSVEPSRHFEKNDLPSHVNFSSLALQNLPKVGRENCVACRSAQMAIVRPQFTNQNSIFSSEVFTALYDRASSAETSLPTNSMHYACTQATTSSETMSSCTSLPLSGGRFPVDDVEDESPTVVIPEGRSNISKLKESLDLDMIFGRSQDTETNEVIFGSLKKREPSASLHEAVPSTSSNKVPATNTLLKAVPESENTLAESPASNVQIKDVAIYNAKGRESLFSSTKISKGSSEQPLESWTKDAIKQSLSGSSDDKALRKEALALFKNVQCYMGDRKSKLSPDQLALALCDAGFSREAVADELFCQVMKQLTGNEKYDSVRRGWELLAIFLTFFVPHSEETLQKLTLFVDANSDHLLDSPEVPVSHYATQCFRRIRSIQPKQKPTLQLIQESRVHIFSPPQFSASLEDLMVMQAEKYPERKLPWLETTLIELILSADGQHTEGLFRIAADPDHVNTARLRLDKGLIPVVRDAHVPAALLKLWLRQLPEPLIPDALYTRCLNVSDSADESCRIVDLLPVLNRLVLAKLVALLQLLAVEETVKYTKMDVCNLAMVMAPNVLRCGSDDPRVIFDNTRKEMSFVKTLITHYDSSYIQSII